MDNQIVKEAAEENVIVVECLNDFLQAINDMRKQIREAEGKMLTISTSSFVDKPIASGMLFPESLGTICLRSNLSLSIWHI